jgi:hypothetical protein
LNSVGYPAHNCSGWVACFRSKIRWYFCFLVLALSPCHGNEPRRKYIKTNPRLSISSLLLCSTPIYVHIHIQIYQNIYKYKHIDKYLSRSIYLYVHISIYTYMCSNMYHLNESTRRHIEQYPWDFSPIIMMMFTQIHNCFWVCIYMYIYIYIYIYTYIYIYINIYIYIYILIYIYNFWTSL